MLAAYITQHRERIADVFAPRIEIELCLRRRISSALDQRCISQRAEPARKRFPDRPCLVVTTRPQAPWRQRHRCDDIRRPHVGVLECGLQLTRELVGRCEPRVKLEIERECIEWRVIVGQRNGRVEMRGLRNTPPARQMRSTFNASGCSRYRSK